MITIVAEISLADTLSLGFIVALCALTEDTVSNERENTALRNTEQKPNRDSDSPPGTSREVVISSPFAT